MADTADTTRQRSELGGVTLSALFIGGLIADSLWVLRPFLVVAYTLLDSWVGTGAAVEAAQ